MIKPAEQTPPLRWRWQEYDARWHASRRLECGSQAMPSNLIVLGRVLCGSSVVSFVLHWISTGQAAF